MEGYGFITDQSKCRQCGVCIRECYADAREMMGRKYSEEELLTEILRTVNIMGCPAAALRSAEENRCITVKS